MKGIWALAVITCKEGLRSRSVLGILFFSLFILGLNVAVAGFFMRNIGKVTVDMNLSALSFSGLLLVLFVGLNLIGKDIERKTIHLVLTKPLSRVQYLWGKYLGILLFVLCSLLVLLVFCVGTIVLLRGLYRPYFEPFSWVVFFQAALFIYVKLAVLSAIALFFTTITTSSFITLIFTICSYLVGETIEEVVFYLRSGLNEEGFSAALERTIEICSYVFPNFSVFDLKLEAAHALAIAPDRTAYALAYAVTYIVLMLILGSMVFRRREFN